MNDRPQIRTAIPKQRYQISDYSATLLGEIDSGDARRYRYVLAFVPMGQAEPTLYVTSEHAPPVSSDKGKYLLRLISDMMSETLDQSDAWGDADRFVEKALQLATNTLGVPNVQVMRLM